MTMDELNKHKNMGTDKKGGEVDIEKEMTSHPKNVRGGRRVGAGRPKGTSKLYAFRADKEVSAMIDAQDNKTVFIRECIIKEMQAQSSVAQPVTLNKLGVAIPSGRVKPMELPFFDMKIVAGFPIPLNNDEMAQRIELLQILCPHTDSCYLIQVQGTSMIDAGVNDGDILIVDKSLREPTEKQIAVCELNGEYTVKRVQEKDGHWWLIPANTDFNPIEVSDGDTFNVWGTVTFIIHKPKE